MMRGRKTVIWALGGVLVSTSANAVTPGSTPAGGSPDSPYGGIVERNVFNLHDPPKPPDPADLIKKDPLPKITLTGITTILGRKLTFLTLPPTKPGTLPESLTLAEGQAQNEIEVKQIDEKAGVVKVINHGENQTLDFEHDGAKPSGPPAATGAPNIPRPAAPPLNVLPIQNGNMTRPIRPFGQQRNVPQASSRNGSALQSALNQGGVAAQNSAPLSPEEHVALIEIQRAKMQQEGNPYGKLLPPTEMSDPAPQ